MDNKLNIEHFIHKGSLWTKNFKPDLARCRFSVAEHGRVTDWHQCTRKATRDVEGYGFCKQHANEIESRLGIRTDTTKTKYAAAFSNGKPNLIELEILSETEYTIEICGYKELMGSSFGIYRGRLKKNSQYTNKYAFFDGKNDAIRHLINEAADYVRDTERIHEEAIRTQKALLDAWYVPAE